MVAGPVVAAAALAMWPWQGVLGCSALLFIVADAGLRASVATPTRAGDLPQGRNALATIRRKLVAYPLAHCALQHIARLPGLEPPIALAAGVNLRRWA